jgi:hypothetical protein
LTRSMAVNHGFVQTTLLTTHTAIALRNGHNKSPFV